MWKNTQPQQLKKEVLDGFGNITTLRLLYLSQLEKREKRPDCGKNTQPQQLKKKVLDSVNIITLCLLHLSQLEKREKRPDCGKNTQPQQLKKKVLDRFGKYYNFMSPLSFTA